jgi:uncharacterized protein YjbJ (UPF0337 family)
MDREHVKGAADKVKGAVKDTAGKVMGDEKMQAEGKMDKAKGAAHNAAGDAKDTARDALAATLDTRMPPRRAAFLLARFRFNLRLSAVRCVQRDRPQPPRKNYFHLGSSRLTPNIAFCHIWKLRNGKANSN